MLLNRHSLKTLCLAGAAIAWLTGCESGNHQNLAANQAVSVDAQSCGSRAHGEFWFELTDQTSTNDTYICPNGSLGSSIHFLEAQFQCEQGQVIATGTTRLDPDPISSNCNGGGTSPNPNPMPPPNPTPQVCSPGATQSCPIANGSGRQTCNATGSEWNDCQVTSCNSNFIQSGNSCIQNNFTGSGLFHCDAPSHCHISCGNDGRLFRIERGDRGFCSSDIPVNPAGTLSGTGAGNWGWIEGDYHFLTGHFFKANTTNVNIKVSCDVNQRSTRIMFGRQACTFEERGVMNSSTRTRPIWIDGPQQFVTLTGQDLVLDLGRFYPFNRLKKRTAITWTPDEFSGPVLYDTVWWRSGQRTRNNRGTTVIELNIRANMNYKATKY